MIIILNVLKEIPDIIRLMGIRKLKVIRKSKQCTISGVAHTEKGLTLFLEIKVTSTKFSLHCYTLVRGVRIDFHTVQTSVEDTITILNMGIPLKDRVRASLKGRKDDLTEWKVDENLLKIYNYMIESTYSPRVIVIYSDILVFRRLYYNYTIKSMNNVYYFYIFNTVKFATRDTSRKFIKTVFRNKFKIQLKRG